MSDDKFLTRQTLLLRAQNQSDHEAWEEFIEVYRLFIYHILNKMNVHKDDCDDLCQEILLKLWEKLKSYNPEKGRFRTWMSFVIRNLVLNSFKKSDIRSRKINELAADPSQSNGFKADNTTELEQTIEREWKLYISNLALENIRCLFSGKAVDVFERSLKGHSNGEIANELELSDNTVKVLKHRVKTRYVAEVKKLIRDYEDG